ncbi:ABC transporter ATP-binding protein [Rhodobacteraceae bacterium NNCM2]|nr:ABC transporter ATP-binding protein [Coraliihabitans acroporae]
MTENAADKWASYAVGFALLIVVSAMTGLSAYIMEDVINEIFVNRRQDMIYLIAAAVIGIFTVKGLAAYFNALILARVGNSIVARLQRRMYDAILAQNLSYFEGLSLGDVLVRFQNGARGAREAVNTLILSIGRDLLSLISLIAVMIVQDPTMSILSLVIGPPAVLGVMYLMKRVKSVAKDEFSSMGKLISLVKETFLGVKIVKTFRLEDHMRVGVDEAIQSVQNLNNNMARLGALTVPMMETLGGFAVAAAVMYGGMQVVAGQSEPGAFFSFLTALLLAYEPARRLARFNVQFQQYMIGVTMVYGILDQVEAETEREDGPDLVISDGAVRLENLTFAYAKEPVLNDLTMDFPANKITALVGPSGAGKSTIFGLLTRLRAPRKGDVLIDGQDIKGFSAHSIRSQIAMVTQDSFLFEGTIYDNIRMGKLDATREEIEAAAEAANAHDFILEQPDGYQTQVGDGGGLLSGGQRQRVAIARAMLADSPILLLDEATSALDSVSEEKVQSALAKLMKGRTTIVIAHRLSTVRDADLIHVMDKGRCVESGTHEELVERESLYAMLHAMQFKTPQAKPAEQEPATTDAKA